MEETADQRRKRLANIRQKRYYKSHSDLIKKQAQADRDELLQLRLKCDCPPPPTVAEPEPEPVTIFNEENVVEFINALDINTKTKSKYVRDIKAVFRITDCGDLGGCLRTFTKIRKAMDGAKQPQYPDRSYAVNTKKGYVQSILFVIDKLNIPMKTETKKLYNNWFDELKVASSSETTERKSNPDNAVLSYPDYLKKIKDKFGEDSKEFLIASIYQSVPARDNFGSLEILPSMRKNDNSTDNLLIVPRSKNAPLKIVIQQFKTIGKYGVMTFVLPDDLSTLIRKYIIKNSLTTRLFPDNNSGLSGFISKMHKKIDVVGSVNTLRKMSVSTYMRDTNLTAKERVEQANRHAHSAVTAMSYERMIRLS